MTQNQPDIQDLLPLYFAGNLNKEQSEGVHKWIEESEAHRQVAKEMSEVCQTIDKLYVAEHTDTSAALKKITRQMRDTHRTDILRRIERIAAVLFIPLLMVSLLQAYNALRPAPAGIMTFTTMPGMTGSVTLPDGTQVKLNSNSTLSYPSEFRGGSREVALKGEAYFAVTEDRRHPFTVSTPCHAKINVYGTHFNVEAYPEDNQVKATLERGSIALNYERNNGSWTERKIIPGQAITYSEAQRDIVVADVEVEVATSWKDGRLVFRNTPVREVLHSLAKRFGVVFTVRNQSVYDNAFTGTLGSQHLDRILEILSLSSNMHFRYLPDNDSKEGNQLIEIY